MQGLVYTYDYPEEELRLVLSEFPALTFYENGTVAADWSHNQGWAGRFWPYTLYQYSPDSGVYEETGSVDAWDLECAGGDERLAAAFPDEADAGGAEPLEIPYRPLEEVNISALGCPRPEVAYPEPVG